MGYLDALRDMIMLGFEKFGRYYSCYRAFVVSNEDPDNLQRLQLVIPNISGQLKGKKWIFPRNVYSGDGYGSQNLPRRGDMVWVEFEFGHPERPIWSHGHFGVIRGEKNRKEKPGDRYDHYNNHWFVTPSGASVEMFDGDENTQANNPEDRFPDAEITVKDVFGNSYTMNQDTIKVTNKHGDSIKIEQDLIQFRDGSFGGLIKIQELITQVDKNSDILDTIKQVMSTPVNEPGNGSPSALQQALNTSLIPKTTADLSNIENDKITHG